MTASSRSAAESGFTLLEVLVAMAMAIPIMLALVTILTVTTHQTQHTLAEVNATQQARGGLATVENALHSACVAQGVDPVLAGSTPTSLRFLSYTGTDDSPGQIVWNVLALSGTSLVDTTYNTVANSQVANVGYSQGSQISATTILTNTTALSGQPVFAYYAYKPYLVGSVYDWIIPDGTNPLPGTTSTYPTPSPLVASGAGGLTATAASSTVEVVISLSVGASEHYYGAGTYAGTADPVNDSISLRLTTPPDSTTSASMTGNYGPCQ